MTGMRIGQSLDIVATGTGRSMNERIKQLAEQAGLEFTYDSTETPMRVFVEAWGEDLEKFAELLVRECRDIVGKTRDTAIEDEWNVDEAMSTAMYDIDEHFGVEE